MKSNTKEFIWNTIGVTINAIYSTIIMMLIARLFVNGVDLSGKFSYAFYISAVFATIGNYGGRIHYISDNSKRYTNKDYILSRIISSIIMIIVTFIFCISNSYNVSKLLLIMSFVLFRAFESMSETYYGIIQKKHGLEKVGKSLTIKSIVSSILFIIILLVSNDLIVASFSYCIIFFLVLVLYDKKCIKINDKGTYKKALSLLKETFGIFILVFLTLFIMNITRYFVDLRLNDIAQSYYTILILPASLINLLSNILLQPNLILLSKYNDENDNVKFNNIVRKMLIELSILTLLAALLIYILGPEIYNILLNMDFSSYRFGLSLGVLSGLCLGIFTIFYNILIIKRKTNIQIFLFIAVIIFGIILSILFAKSITSAIYVYFSTMLFGSILIFLLYKITLIKENR